MPWFRLDIHWYEEEKLEAAAESAGRLGPLVLALFPVFLAKAKAQTERGKAGKADFTYRLLAAEVFAPKKDIEAAIEAMVSARVLTCPHMSDRGATVAFNPSTWRKWNEAGRKAEERELRKAA